MSGAAHIHWNLSNESLPFSAGIFFMSNYKIHGWHSGTGDNRDFLVRTLPSAKSSSSQTFGWFIFLWKDFLILQNIGSISGAWIERFTWTRWISSGIYLKWTFFLTCLIFNAKFKLIFYSWLGFVYHYTETPKHISINYFLLFEICFN